ncbi:MAG: hypothetical protein Q9188_006857 [Gyalolechia gomerana]
MELKVGLPVIYLLFERVPLTSTYFPNSLSFRSRLYMNHLPWPQNSCSPPIEVPYVCSDLPGFDGLNFSQYPVRRGWSTQEDKFQWMNGPPILTARRAQDWLYLGLLQLFLGRLFNKQDFISLSPFSNAWILDSLLLPRRLSDLVRTVKKDSTGSNDELLYTENLRDKWNDAFLDARMHLEILDVRMDNESIAPDETLSLVTASIAILFESLQNAAEEIFFGPDEEPPAMCLVDLAPANLSLRRMLDVNRCKAQIRTLHLLYNPFLNHYVSGLPYNQLESGHEGCSWHRCLGNNVDEGSYKTQHVHESCSCDFIGPDPSQLNYTIQNDQIPLAELRIMHGKPELKIIPARLGNNYVTLSHVWAGGLGNFKENKLPTCQLLKLFDLLLHLENFRPGDPRSMAFRYEGAWYICGIRLLSLAKKCLERTVSLVRVCAVRISQMNNRQVRDEVSPPVHFWMDTLCIPVDPQHYELRLKAIGNMALTYAAAERCLVLDPELQHISMKGLKLTQLNAHVLCSVWLTRSWTFQEARLSRAWYAQFADGLYNPNCEENATLNFRLYNPNLVYRDDCHKLAGEMIRWYHDMPAVRQTDLYANQLTRFLSDSFISVWNHLASRSTSKMDDVNGILANTLDLSAKEVLELPPERRMQAVLRVQEKLPVGMMYNRVRKISNRSCRWVPLYPEGTGLSSVYGFLRPSQEGFFLDKVEGNPVGFLVDPWIPRYENLCLVDSEGSSRLWITFIMEPEGPPISYAAPGHTIKVCYVLGHIQKSSTYRKVTSRFQGARFALRKREGKTLHLVYEYALVYSHHQRPGEEIFETVYGERADADAEFHVDSADYQANFSISLREDLSSWPNLKYRRDTANQNSLHGLHFYITSLFACFAVVWTPSVCLSAASTHPPDLLRPLFIFFIRVAIMCYEITQIRARVNEHAYQAWVKTFDELGSLRQRDGGKKDHQGWNFSTRLKIGLGVGIAGPTAPYKAINLLMTLKNAPKERSKLIEELKGEFRHEVSSKLPTLQQLAHCNEEDLSPLTSYSKELETLNAKLAPPVEISPESSRSQVMQRLPCPFKEKEASEALEKLTGFRGELALALSLDQM